MQPFLGTSIYYLMKALHASIVANEAQNISYVSYERILRAMHRKAHLDEVIERYVPSNGIEEYMVEESPSDNEYSINE